MKNNKKKEIKEFIIISLLIEALLKIINKRV